ncbi:metallophosphoesterase family protein [Paraoerskovia sediminicola]|nr:metallophosphoesterase [Paraoerskovia sediminicola]
MIARRRSRRWVRWVLLALAVLVACLTFGVTTATANLSLGPHEAEYDITTNGLATVDFGPLGSLEIDSPAPLGIGVDVVVGEIPSQLRELDESTPLDALAGDAQSYLQFFGSPEATISSAIHALVTDAIWRTLIAIAVVVIVIISCWLLLGSARRRELARSIAPRTWEVASGALVLVLVAGTLSSGTIRGPEPEGSASPVFAGTGLEGARITGRLSGIVDTYGTQLLETYRDNERFYATADEKLDAAWDERLAQENIDAIAASVGLRGPVVKASADDDYVTFLVVSDLHCNTGMAPLIATSAIRSGADVVLDAGDTTMNGTSVEDVCVTALTGALPDGVPLVVADGNHDSATTSAQERAQGATVLDGSVVEVAGVRILGDHDALQTNVLTGSSVADDDLTPDEQTRELTQTACADGAGVDLLLLHTPRVGNGVLDSGCVPMQVSGHLHKRVDPVQVGGGIQYINSSTAGAILNQPTVGPLHGTAEMTVLRFDPDRRRFVDYQVVSVDPAQQAQVGPRIPMPVLLPFTPTVDEEGEPVAVATDAPTGAPTDGAPRAATDSPSATPSAGSDDAPEASDGDPSGGAEDAAVDEPTEVPADADATGGATPSATPAG